MVLALFGNHSGKSSSWKFSDFFDDSPPYGKDDNPIKVCDHPECQGTGSFRAPKSRYQLESHMNDWFWFCLIHIREYNAQWNYYANMTREEIEKERYFDVTWQRQTWPLGQSASSLNSRGGKDPRYQSHPFQDPFNLFGDDTTDATDSQSKKTAREKSLFLPATEESSAMAILGLSYPFTISELRKRYRDLVKMHHPDTNRVKGDVSSEDTIKNINGAYQVLKRQFG